MANEEQLAILNQGVEVWNRWREQNRRVKIDLIKVDLRSKSSTAATDSLWRPDWRAELGGANLKRADLSGAILIEAYLRRANLHGANLTEADFNYANLSETILEEATL
jgi:uncharacterized protein YjbI with pentapeptide repeats